MSVNDILISPNKGQPNQFVSVSPRLTLSGTIFAPFVHDVGVLDNMRGSVTVTERVVQNGVELFSGTGSISLVLGNEPFVTSALSSDGLLFNDFLQYSGGVVDVVQPTLTPYIGIMTGVPVNLQLSLEVETGIGLGIGTNNRSAASGVDFNHTFGFSTSGPAFDVPDGFTVNSVEANIVDNSWQGVPEPCSVTLGSVALLGLLCFRLKFHKRKV